MQLTLSVRELLTILEFIGIDVDIPEDVSTLEECITIREGEIQDGLEVIYKHGLIAYLTDYPEEGSIGLEDDKYI